MAGWRRMNSHSSSVSLAGLSRIASEHADLADVVHQRAAINVGQLFFVVNAEHFCDVQRVRSDAHRVAPGFLVAHIQGGYKRLERPRVRLSELLRHVTHFDHGMLQLRVRFFEPHDVIARAVDELLHGVAAEQNRQAEHDDGRYPNFLEEDGDAAGNEPAAQCNEAEARRSSRGSSRETNAPRSPS